MRRVGIIGCGAIGTALAKALEHRDANTAGVVALHDHHRTHALRLQRELVKHPPVVSLRELIRRSQLVIEAASVTVSARVARESLLAHRDVLIMSTGGLVLNRSWETAVRRSRARLYIPSGALAGLDGLKGMAVGTIRRIRLTTRKPPRALMEAPFVRRRHLNLTRLRRPKVLLEGSPREVVRAFPQNSNVAATTILASFGRSRHTTVRVVADPGVSMNTHELEVEGDAGRICCLVESRPSRMNLKTSELAIRSALATLEQIFNPITIGT